MLKPSSCLARDLGHKYVLHYRKLDIKIQMWSCKDVFAVVLCKTFFQVSLLFRCVIWILLAAAPQPPVILLYKL